MSVDLNEIVQELFQSCADGIKNTDPSLNQEEWEFYWGLMITFKSYKERRAKIKNDTAT